MNYALWIGVFPGLSPGDINYMIETIHQAVKELQ